MDTAIEITRQLAFGVGVVAFGWLVPWLAQTVIGRMTTKKKPNNSDQLI